MHAFLLLNFSEHKDLQKILNLSKTVKVIEFSGQTVEDVRTLRDFTKLKVISPTIILIKNIDTASREAQNTLLKFIEEPQPNLYFALTGINKENILPTILSRCKLINIVPAKENVHVQRTEAEEFLTMTTGQKFEKLGKIKDRERAIEFLSSMITGSQSLLADSVNINIEPFVQTHEALLSNGNVQLQLTKLVVTLEQSDRI